MLSCLRHFVNIFNTSYQSQGHYKEEEGGQDEIRGNHAHASVVGYCYGLRQHNAKIYSRYKDQIFRCKAVICISLIQIYGTPIKKYRQLL